MGGVWISDMWNTFSYQHKNKTGKRLFLKLLGFGVSVLEVHKPISSLQKKKRDAFYHSVFLPCHPPIPEGVLVFLGFLLGLVLSVSLFFP